MTTLFCVVSRRQFSSVGRLVGEAAKDLGRITVDFEAGWEKRMGFDLEGQRDYVDPIY
jgi:hypothetical protein